MLFFGDATCIKQISTGHLNAKVLKCQFETDNTYHKLSCAAWDVAIYIIVIKSRLTIH